MFRSLAEKFSSVFRVLGRSSRLAKHEILRASEAIKVALLDADMSYQLVDKFINELIQSANKEIALGHFFSSERFIEFVHDKLTALVDHGNRALYLNAMPSVIMVCGLQGTGKTTHVAKLAKLLKKENPHKKILIVSCDLQRPAAIDQLSVLAKEIDIDFCSPDQSMRPFDVAKKAFKKAFEENYDVLLVDTAGRLHVDETLMSELQGIKKIINPHEVLFALNVSHGQDAVNTAKEFDKKVNISGFILTMTDSEAKPGAALSVSAETGKPIKLEGFGEHHDDIQFFEPESLAQRLIGFGDVINFKKTAQECFVKEDRESIKEKLVKAQFTYEDYLNQMQGFKKMGPLKKLMRMMPIGMIGSVEETEKEMKHTEAMILSMTLEERQEKVPLTDSRIRRIVKGSGVHVSEFNKLRKFMKQSKEFFKGGLSKEKIKEMMGGFR
ncbi:signal recognition particle protein [Candidatus Clavichlamydia salmonicola]|uniref:signal recognition particle protein n=1 Tax=Candidatus Clavichlamydia salmonicola TaxID=469812 RepID=UPI001891DB08|nr:signal recognition particle receptor subunit alpha [Candidatus Clavichlamydia salmonicola]